MSTPANVNVRIPKTFFSPLTTVITSKRSKARLPSWKRFVGSISQLQHWHELKHFFILNWTPIHFSFNFVQHWLVLESNCIGAADFLDEGGLSPSHCVFDIHRISPKCTHLSFFWFRKLPNTFVPTHYGLNLETIRSKTPFIVLIYLMMHL